MDLPIQGVAGHAGPAHDRARPSGESIRSCIRAVWLAGAAGSRPWKNATCRTVVVAGVRRHCAEAIRAHVELLLPLGQLGFAPGNDSP